MRMIVHLNADVILHVSKLVQNTERSTITDI